MNQTQSPSRPVTTPLERPKPLAKMEAALNGKFFMFVFRQGTRFRSARIIAAIPDQFIKVRYFRLKTRDLMSFKHMVKLYSEPSVEDMTGWLRCDACPPADV